ncbi:MAG: adenylate/guanylate cyclase domain-containing protein [Betaproteobacteria bacterium]
MLNRLRIFLRSAPAVVAVITLLMFTLLSTWDVWRRMEYKGYDLLMVFSAPGRSTLPITIVGIDEPSFAQIGKQWPWPRRMHGELLEQLNRAGALVVGFDVLLSEPSNDEDDTLLANAIRKAGNVVLTADLVYQETQYVRQWLRVEPIDAFKAAGAGNGLATIPRDSDLVLRRAPEGRDVFWREIVRMVNKVRPGLIEEPPSQPDRMIGYVGPDRTFPYVSYYQALHADTDLPPDVFRDQIVLIGRYVRSSVEMGGSDDNFATPFTGINGWLTPGVEIHANILESALSRRDIAPLSPAWNLLLLTFAVLSSAFLMRHWRPLRSALVAMLLLGFIAAGDWLLFSRYNLWLPAIASMLSVTVVYASLGAHAFLSEQRQRRETRRAFSMYLAPEVVNQIMAHPDKLKLGGERKEITLLFTDLAGFTNISEQLGPEQVAQLLNEHFSRATAIIKQHGGTVNRFIGDAIMAIWNAPLEDPQHALNACLAGCEMQRDMKQLRVTLAERGLPPIAMRVGIHTGSAIVGNLGASDRFDYTAIGDSVNLAARLEGVNKFYGTEILLSGATAQLLNMPADPALRLAQGERGLGKNLLLRPVDRVIVKGKSEATDIFTPTDDEQLIALTTTALQAYRAQQWDESEKDWRSILQRYPDDRISVIYLERIAGLRDLPPAAGMTDATALEKL